MRAVAYLSANLVCTPVAQNAPPLSCGRDAHAPFYCCPPEPGRLRHLIALGALTSSSARNMARAVKADGDVGAPRIRVPTTDYEKLVALGEAAYTPKLTMIHAKQLTLLLVCGSRHPL